MQKHHENEPQMHSGCWNNSQWTHDAFWRTFQSLWEVQKAQKQLMNAGELTGAVRINVWVHKGSFGGLGIAGDNLLKGFLCENDSQWKHRLVLWPQEVTQEVPQKLVQASEDALEHRIHHLG